MSIGVAVDRLSNEKIQTLLDVLCVRLMFNEGPDASVFARVAVEQLTEIRKLVGAGEDEWTMDALRRVAKERMSDQHAKNAVGASQQERQERAQDALRMLGLYAPAYALPTAGEVDLRDLRRSLHGLYDVRPDHRPEIEEAIDALGLYWASRR